MNLGASELLILLVLGVPFLIVPLWALVDIAQQPERAWKISGRNQTAWLLGVILGWLLGFGLIGTIVAMVYLVGPRRQLRRAASETPQPTEHAPPGWYVDPQGTGQRSWDGAAWADEYRSTESTAQGSTPPSVVDGASISHRLAHLENLREEGRITDHEYQHQRQRLLNEL